MILILQPPQDWKLMLMVCVLVGFNVYAVLQILGTIFDPVKYTGDNENLPTVNVSG